MKCYSLLFLKMHKQMIPKTSGKCLRKQSNCFIFSNALIKIGVMIKTTVLV